MNIFICLAVDLRLHIFDECKIQYLIILETTLIDGCCNWHLSRIIGLVNVSVTSLTLYFDMKQFHFVTTYLLYNIQGRQYTYKEIKYCGF